MTTYSRISFDNRFITLPQHFYRPVAIAPLSQLRLRHFNLPLARRMGLPDDVAADAGFVRAINGEIPFAGTQSIAMKYTGHQFGVYNPELGDGRGLLLGEVLHEAQRYELHLKGAGATPFARFGDGRAVLRSTIREYLASAYMRGIGIPTTEALALFSSDSLVQREDDEPAAMLIRVAPTHIRFGHFEYLYYHDLHADIPLLLDYLLEHHFPHIPTNRDAHAALFHEVVLRSAHLVAQWQAQGFCHGVLNTDNMSMLGITLDYGPYAFLDRYDHHYICNRTDRDGRYAFSQQPSIVRWNLQALAQALTPAITLPLLQESLAAYSEHFGKSYEQLLLQRLGLPMTGDDSDFLASMLNAMHHSGVDHATFFGALVQSDTDDWLARLHDTLANPDAVNDLRNWHAAYRERCADVDEAVRQSLLRKHNPVFRLRNYYLQLAIADATRGNYSTLDQLFTLCEAPFTEQQCRAVFREPPPDAMVGIPLSCSS